VNIQAAVAKSSSFGVLGGMMNGMGGMGGSVDGHTHDAPRPGLPPENLDPNSFSLAGKVEEGICKNCTILRATAQLTNEAGKGVSIGSGLYLHHIVMTSKGGDAPPPGTFGRCAQLPGIRPAYDLSKIPGINRAMGSMLLAQAIENFTTWYTTGDGKFDSGFHAGNYPYILSAEVVNYKPEEQKVFVTVDYDYVPGTVGLNVGMMFASANG
jgi:hypothetical protein